MKRVALIRYLRKQGCVHFREGGNHSIYLNPLEKKVSAIPRHREIFDILILKICKDLGIKSPF
ncbi:MAG: type II toxin-antitoxin system HicA family toxin [Candidatus Hydrogenedentes bacterium]|nr:type II toxin-antitoxin system HicA family toxin [Candidatus Hydrogenedentota bacterium]